MIAIKSDAMKTMPEYCDDCIWYGTRPHPHKGWIDICELMAHCMDDDQDEEWIYDGNGRPKACPLVEIIEQTEPKTEKSCETCKHYNTNDFGYWCINKVPCRKYERRDEQADCPWK